VLYRVRMVSVDGEQIVGRDTPIRVSDVRGLS